MGFHAKRLQTALDDALKVIEGYKRQEKDLYDKVYEAQLQAQDYKNQVTTLTTERDNWKAKSNHWATACGRVEQQLLQEKTKAVTKTTANPASWITRARHEEIVNDLQTELEQTRDDATTHMREIETLRWRLDRIRTTALGMHDGLKL